VYAAVQASTRYKAKIADDDSLVGTRRQSAIELPLELSRR
jgi:hypothetical protein